MTSAGTSKHCRRNTWGTKREICLNIWKWDTQIVPVPVPFYYDSLTWWGRPIVIVIFLSDYVGAAEWRAVIIFLPWHACFSSSGGEILSQIENVEMKENAKFSMHKGRGNKLVFRIFYGNNFLLQFSPPGAGWDHQSTSQIEDLICVWSVWCLSYWEEKKYRYFLLRKTSARTREIIYFI